MPTVETPLLINEGTPRSEGASAVSASTDQMPTTAVQSPNGPSARSVDDGFSVKPPAMQAQSTHVIDMSAPSSPTLPPDEGKFGNPYLRFSVLFAVLVVAIATLPLWISFIIPRHGAAYVFAAGTLFFSSAWLVIAFNAVRNYRKLGLVPIPPWNATDVVRARTFKHIVIVPCYLDPLDVLHAAIESVAQQTRTDNLVVVVTFEKKTPGLDEKIRSVSEAFNGRFGAFLPVVHVLDKRTEIPGGCSNKNFAIRAAYQYCAEHFGGPLVFDPANGTQERFPRYTITTCDTDSKFHPRHFEVLESCYNTENPSNGAAVSMNVWQPPLFYNWDLDQRPFFNRVTHLMRMMMMLGGLISFNINPMSIFSYPLELGYAAGFINPRYGVDDIIAKVRWMCCTNSAVPVKLLPVIAISGPTIGTSFTDEAHELGRQVRRWIIGASESFHYFIIHWRGKPLFSGIAWAFIFFTYYAVLLCSAGIFNVLASIPYPWVDFPVIDFAPGYSFSLKYVGAVALGLQMIAFAVAFALDALACRNHLHIKENMSPLRNFAHWLVSPVVLLVYSLIAFVSIVRFVFEGKKLAGHDMAGKDGLQAASGSPTSSPTAKQPNNARAAAGTEAV